MECLEANFAYAFYRASATRISRVIQVKPMLLLRFSIHSVRTQKLRHNGLLKGREEGEKLAACMTIIFFSPIFSSCHLKRSQMTLWYTDAIHTIMHSILTQKEDRRTGLWSKITKILVDSTHFFFSIPTGKYSGYENKLIQFSIGLKFNRSRIFWEKWVAFLTGYFN